ncbi:MAG: ABC transporter permease subunit, partial [Planctomycetales bacterium]|nr:ABC transporter permease subunit [Planctomycetales bacterium]
ASADPQLVSDARHDMWAFLLQNLFRYPQAALMVLALGIASPPMISHDLRSRAYLIYFARPIGRIEYLLGKLGTLAFFLAMITTVPALMFYLTGLMLSPDLSVAGETWDLPLRILGASAALILPTTSIALMFSSLTTESRYAGFAWYAFWILGRVAYGVLTAGEFVRRHGELPPDNWYAFYSPYHLLGVVQTWIFNPASPPAHLNEALATVIGATVASLAVVSYRIGSPLRA